MTVGRVWGAIICLEAVAAVGVGFALRLLAQEPATTASPEIWQYPAAAMFTLAAFVQVICLGLHRGWRWARLAAIALLVLSVPSLAFPAAVGGLLLLADGRVWSEYVKERSASASRAARVEV